MSHPVNKFERQLIGKNKGQHRSEGFWRGTKNFSPAEIEEFGRHLRDSTKRCSCKMCCNPRKLGYVTRKEEEQERLWNDFVNGVNHEQANDQ